jgi:hypothetical protein
MPPVRALVAHERLGELASERAAAICGIAGDEHGQLVELTAIDETGREAGRPVRLVDDGRERA